MHDHETFLKNISKITFQTTSFGICWTKEYVSKPGRHGNIECGKKKKKLKSVKDDGMKTDTGKTDCIFKIWRCYFSTLDLIPK